jgi:diaminohydroxyphosphoribosylaminopyrimidine deaminase/5-amino-6-(5-phosphoribosylamino)uracil reductase
VPQPVRVVLSRRLDLPLDGHLARTAREVPVWLIHGREASEEARAAWRGRRAADRSGLRAGGHLDVTEALAALGEAGLTRVFCEGGGTLAAALSGGGSGGYAVAGDGGRRHRGGGHAGGRRDGRGGLSEAPSLRLAGSNAGR